MVVVFGTLGHMPRALLPAIEKRQQVERLVYFYSGDEKGRKAKEQVERYCRGMDLRYEAILVRDVYDLIKSSIQIRRKIRETKAQGKEVVFNITGGTKVVACAALLACILESVPTVYEHELTRKEIDLPLLSLRYDEVLSERQRQILRFILQRGGMCVAKELVAHTGRRKTTISHHVKTLARRGLIRVENSPEDSRQKLLRVVPYVELLVGE